MFANVYSSTEVGVVLGGSSSINGMQWVSHLLHIHLDVRANNLITNCRLARQWHNMMLSRNSETQDGISIRCSSKSNKEDFRIYVKLFFSV